jgi:uncharacterized repeat protein (TIGR01451 family)
MLQKSLSSRSLKPEPEVSMRTVLIRLCLWCVLQPFFLWGTGHSLYAQSSLPSDQLIALTRDVAGFDNPVHITHAGDGSQRLFVVEQEGRIRIVKSQTLLSTAFLDISSRVSCCGERGLLSVAFPPNYANKGHFYVNYTNNDGNTVIARYRVTSDPDVANLNSEEILLTIEQPFANHNGGQIAFGPDGYLYIGMGDGGSNGDPQGNGQRPETLLGKLLRIDVESGVTPYAVPSNNPFVQSRFYRGEIWALGLRNPWRFSFDRQTGDLYLGDVGQGSYEEINFQSRASFGGENYGWNIMEGKHCFNSDSCNQTGLVLPIVEYRHSEGCSVTGGVVYRGQQYPRLQGLYLYGDYCSGTIWGLKGTSTAVQQGLLLDSGYSISTFGEDEAGETYVADHGGGTIYRITDPNAPSGANLTLSVTDAPDPVIVNNELTYSATITNNGPSSTAGVQMNILLPAGATFVSVSSSQGSCTGTATVNFQLNTLANGAKATVTLVLKPTATGGLSLTVSVSGSESDPGADNNTVTSVTSVSSNQPSPQPIDGPDFTGSWQSITQSCKGSGATRKCKLEGTVVVENRGTQKAASSALQFYLSDNSVFDAGDTLLASTTTSSIKTGKAKKKKLKVTLPIGSNASGQYVIAVLDPVNSEAEGNESNNAVGSGSVP